MEAAPLSRDLFEAVLGEADLSLTAGSVDKLMFHAAEMLRWNRSIRLTAITDPEEVAVKHVVDSLLLLEFAPFPGRTLDFGSGAGYPGVPLAIVLPESRFVLLESSGKKCAFLSRIRSALSLQNVEVVHARLDRVHLHPSVGRFETIVTRAAVPPGDAAPLLSPYLAPGGRLLLMTGPGTGRGGVEAGMVLSRKVWRNLPRGMGERELAEYALPCPGEPVAPSRD